MSNISHKNKCFTFFVLLSGFLFYGCNKNEEGNIQFSVLDGSSTGIHFANNLTSYPDFNMFKYMYFFNGAGVGAADFNNDGLVDLFFASNQGDNKLYINKGKLQFLDVTNKAQIPNDGAWNTGVSIVDINGDGMMDIYLSRVGNFEKLQSKNQFLICKKIDNGVPIYEDLAGEMGLDFSAFGTQAAFFDFDLDGDLDVYMMNHSLRFNGTFYPRNQYENKYDSLAGDLLMRNDNLQFTNISKSAGISGSIISYGLGICISDINMDGYPDIYIGNDFHENDYLYLNNKNGTFKEVLPDKVMHTSQFSMGVDIGDINNDALPEIITMDMLPSDPYLLRRSLGEDAYDLFQHKIKSGYHQQYARNTLQLNRGNTTFSEVGRYAGVHATDWSWSALWTDFDNDGWKDLFVSNGIPKRMNDIDYIKYISNDKFQEKIKTNTINESDMALLNKFPEIKLENKFFQNTKHVKFNDIHASIENDKKTFSNGAAYADLDNDGDLDIIVNNINDEALIYENKQVNSKNTSLKIITKGPKQNLNALGAKVIVYRTNTIQTYENYPVKGFMSCMNIPISIGLGQTKPDSIVLIWPDNGFQKINIHDLKNEITINYKEGLPKFKYQSLIKDTGLNIEEISANIGLLHKHKENPFIEFNREPLMPHMVSREGPAIAIGDINNDGKEDIYIGSSKFDTSVILTQNGDNYFIKSVQKNFDTDNAFEETDAIFADINEDGYLDLIVASGGNEFSAKSKMLSPRIFINDKHGQFNKKNDAFLDEIFLNSSCVEALDYNHDGKIDLFFGGRSFPWEYGTIPSSYLMINNGNGQFYLEKNQSTLISSSGFITDAKVVDLNNDQKDDLVLTTEWSGIFAFINSENGFKKTTLSNLKGWWNCILPVDIDLDGDIDFIAGNLGQNNRFNTSAQNPLRMYYEDFDNNGTKEQILSYYINGVEIPFNNHEELLKQIPSLKKKYLYASDFARASMQDIFSTQALQKATKYEVNYFSSIILLNNGNYTFEAIELPWQVQLSAIKSCSIFDYNDDKLPDILLGGNFYHNNIQMGRYDADYGSVLINKKNNNFDYYSLADQKLNGEVRKILPLTVNKEKVFVLAKNNDSLQVIKFKK